MSRDLVSAEPATRQYLQIHSIFSMLQINRAYVVDCGRLVGVVALADVSERLTSFPQENIVDFTLDTLRRIKAVAN